MSIQSIVDEFKNMSHEQQIMLMKCMYPIVNKTTDSISDYVSEVKELRFSKGSECPICNSKNIVGNGKYRGRQRYKCKTCNKSFNDASFTPMAGTRYPEKWRQFLWHMGKSTPLAKIAKELNINVATAFYWRHKVLNSMRSKEEPLLTGVVESDEKFFLESDKGKKKVTHRKARRRGSCASSRGISKEQVCVIVAMDRNGNIISRKAGMGRVTGRQINSTIGDKIDKDSVFCSDSAKNYAYFAKLKGLVHEKVNIRKKKYVVKGIYHIQHVNSYHERIDTWINRHFNGVATKYMDNYLCWHKFLEIHKSLEVAEFDKKLLISVLSALKSTRISDIK